MKHIDKTIIGKLPPRSKEVMWLDANEENSEAQLKAFINGKWQPVVGSSGGSGFTENVIEITYSKLKNLRGNNNLSPGYYYRITDYQCTTTQEGTQSAGHQFDVIVRADDVNILNENAFAIEHEDDTYFSNANLSAWELKYSLDNDTNRFAWADPTNGKGVIYYMKDEWDNECPYDFKNIQYVFIQGFTVTLQTWEIRTKVYGRNETNDQTIDGTTYYSWIKVAEPSSGGLDLPDEYWTTTLTLSTSMDRYTISNGVATKDTNGSIVSASSEDFDTFTFDSQGTDASLNVSSKTVYGNVILRYIVSNKIALNKIFARANNTLTYYNNKFGNNCNGNTFGNGCYANIFGDNCNGNTFGNDCYDNTFMNNCYRNTFGNSCYSNTFGNSCYSNTFGDSCYSNTFGRNCYTNTFRYYCSNNTFGNDCFNNTFGSTCSRTTFGNNCLYNTFGDNCHEATFGDSCHDNTFGNYCTNNTFGNDCNYITFGSSTQSPQSYFENIIFENGNKYINLTCSQTTSSSNKCRNVLVALGVNNSNTTKTITINAVNQTNRTIVRAAADTEITV